MRTVVLAVTIALVSGSCTLFFGHGTSESSVPDASGTDDGQQPTFPDASDPSVDASVDDADHTNPDAGCGNPGSDADVDAGGGGYPDASVDGGGGYPPDASVPVDAGW